MSITWNHNEVRREQSRRTGNRVLALEALTAAGPRGILNTELMAIAGSRAGGRVDELREQGHDITCEPVDRSRGLYRYTLHVPARTAGPQPGQPGYLASLVPTASITGRVVRPVVDTDTDTVAPGMLF